MELLIVRHGRPHPVTPENWAPGESADPALDAQGRVQAKLVAACLAGGAYGEVTAVVSSTMRRARETAHPLADQLGAEVETDERIVELDEGAQHYSSDGFVAYATREEAWASANSGLWDGHHFDPAAFAARVVAGIEDVVERHPEGRVAVVCHGGAISAYLQHVLRTPAPLFCSAGHGSITRVHAGPGAYRELLSFNEQGHLPQT